MHFKIIIKIGEFLCSHFNIEYGRKEQPSQHTMLYYLSVQFSRSVVSDSLRPHGLQHARPPLSIANSRSLLKFMSIELVMPSNYLILCHPLLLLPSIFPSIRVFSNESVIGASASVLPMNIQDNIQDNNNPLGLLFQER